MMVDIKRVAAAIDFSAYSPQILTYVASISEQFGAEVLAVTVIDRRSVDSVEKLFEKQGREFSRQRFLADETYRRTQSLRELLDDHLLSHVPRRMVIRSGIPFEEILTTIDEEKADLLVIAAKGATNLQGYLFGTTTEKLFRHAPVSVLSLNLPAG